MPILTVPIHEVNHCHGEGKGHPCDVKPTFREDGDTVYLEHPAHRGAGHAGYVELGYGEGFALPKNAAMVSDIAVEDAFRGRGFGQQLYDQAVKKARREGFDFLAASNDQTPDARMAWGRLSRRYKVARIRLTTGEQVPVIDLRRSQ